MCLVKRLLQCIRETDVFHLWFQWFPYMRGSSERSVHEMNAAAQVVAWKNKHTEIKYATKMLSFSASSHWCKPPSVCPALNLHCHLPQIPLLHLLPNTCSFHILTDLYKLRAICKETPNHCFLPCQPVAYLVPCSANWLGEGEEPNPSRESR